jgi:prenyltransferase beta subunit
MNQLLDALLLQGTQGLSSRLRDRVADYVVSKRLADGGYPGRAGSSDLYYTDFALRILSQTRAEEVRRPATCSYARWSSDIADIPECLNRISIASLCDVPMPRMASTCLDRHRLSSGCFSRSASLPVPSSYCTFLGAMCEDMLGITHQVSKDSIETILRVQQPDGGFTDIGSDADPQTNATSAAISYLLRAVLFESPLSGDCGPELNGSMDRAVAYLLHMQASDGGFRAHSKAMYPDLLSTFTALATLMAMDRVRQVDLKKHVRFVGLLADAGGGFRSCAVDTEPDIEYTYYGLNCLSIAAIIAAD